MAIIKTFTIFSSREVDLFYESLLYIIRAHIPDGRLIRPGLEVLAFLLDVDTIPRLAESTLEWQGFLETMAILRKSSEIRVLEAIVKIYAGLTRYDSLRTLVLPVLGLLLGHRFPKVRLAAATALYIIQPNDQLKALDLSGSAKSVREQVQEIYGESKATRKRKSSEAMLSKRGQFLFAIEELHHRYGPLVQIGPNEIHINDPEFYDQIYSLQGRWDKDPAFVNQFDNTDSAFGTVAHDIHRTRRRAFQNFFSKQKIASLESLIQSIVGKLCRRFEGFAGQDKVVPIRHAYECLTNDVVMEYTLGKSDHSVEHPEFNPALHETIKLLGMSGHYMKLIPGIQTVLPFIPPWLITTLVPAMAPIVALQKQCQDLASSIVISAPSYDPKSRAHPTVCHEIYYSDELPPSEKTLRRMQHEIETFVVAGTETTAHAMTCITFHVLENPPVREALKRELATLENVKNARMQQLEQLPYLTGVILEGLRLSYGVATRLPRIAPDRVIQYGNLAMAELYIAIATIFSRFDMELCETTREDVTLRRENFTPQARAESKGVRVLIK
ncbi:MAG: hypothetical protein Q9225_004567 [Loekoesia sp. 1 TL-2023]